MIRNFKWTHVNDFHVCILMWQNFATVDWLATIFKVCSHNGFQSLFVVACWCERDWFKSRCTLHFDQFFRKLKKQSNQIVRMMPVWKCNKHHLQLVWPTFRIHFCANLQINSSQCESRSFFETISTESWDWMWCYQSSHHVSNYKCSIIGQFLNT